MSPGHTRGRSPALRRTLPWPSGDRVYELMPSNRAPRTNCAYLKSLPESVFLLVRIDLIFRNFDAVRHGINEKVLAFFDRRFGFRRILANGHPGISSPHIREEFALIF